MKKALIVKLSMAFVVAISAASWAQEVESSLTDTAASPAVVQGVVSADPIPMGTTLPMASNCGCNQTFTAAPMFAAPMMAAPIQSAGCGCSTCGSCSSCNSCSGCGMVGQVGYNEIIPTASPAVGAPVVTSAPIAAYRPANNYIQPSGCCGQPNYDSGISYSTAAPITTSSAPAATWNSSQCCNTAPAYNACDPCQQQRGLFRGRFFRR